MIPSLLKVKHTDLEVLLADGTKFIKFLNVKSEERKKNLCERFGQTYKAPSNRGEVKILMGINENKEIVPLGDWTSDSWKTIGNAIYKVNNPDKRLAPVKLANYFCSRWRDCAWLSFKLTFWGIL